jgi:sugar diacid utilization regulator
MRNSVAAATADESEKTDCLIILSEFLLEFFDRISGVMTDAYIAEEKHLSARRARTHVALIEDLLHGRQPGDLDTQMLCDRIGIRSGATMAVAIARHGHSGNGQAVDHRRQLERLADIFRLTLASPEFASLIDIRSDEVVAIVAGGRYTSMHVTRVLRAIAPEPGIACRIGVSMDISEIGALPQAFQEAGRAVEFTVADRPVMHFGDINLVEFLVRHPDAAAQRLIPGWADRLWDADGGGSGALSRTIHQFAASDLNVKRTARDLKLHTNTVYFRLNRVRKLTGIDPRSYLGLSLLLTTLKMLDARNERAPAIGSSGIRRSSW